METGQLVLSTRVSPSAVAAFKKWCFRHEVTPTKALRNFVQQCQQELEAGK